MLYVCTDSKLNAGHVSAKHDGDFEFTLSGIHSVQKKVRCVSNVEIRVSRGSVRGLEWEDQEGKITAVKLLRIRWLRFSISTDLSSLLCCL